MTVAEQFIAEYGAWIDRVAEANDNLGTCQGVAITKLQAGGVLVDAVQLVFDHGIVEARLESLELLATRLLTSFDVEELLADTPHCGEDTEMGPS